MVGGGAEMKAMIGVLDGYLTGARQRGWSRWAAGASDRDRITSRLLDGHLIVGLLEASRQSWKGLSRQLFRTLMAS